MKMKLLTLALAVSGITLVGCKDDDNIRVDREIEHAFRKQYSHATRAEWEFLQGYYVADFRLNLIETRAWYTPQGIWHMTEKDVRYADLPQAVKDAFGQSEYAGWRIDDVDHYLTPAGEYYLLELESGNRETRLKIDAGGNVIP